MNENDSYLLENVTKNIESQTSFLNNWKLLSNRENFQNITNLSLKKQLTSLHYYLFNNLHSNAGEFRNVNISKGKTLFANIELLDQLILNLEDDYYDIETPLDLIKIYSEINLIYPFREGNGRVLRLWLDINLHHYFGLFINWLNISKNDYFKAIISSLIDDNNLLYLLNSNLTSNLELKLQKKMLKHTFTFENIYIK